MAYLDRRTRPSRRLVTFAAVGVLEGAAFLAVASGLDVAVIPRLTQPPFVAEQWKLPPPPPPPVIHPKPHPVVKAVPRPVPPAPPLADPAFTTTPPLPLPAPQLLPLGPRIELPPPWPTAGKTMRQASPSNDPAHWVTPDDYPAQAIRAGHEGTAHFSLAIGADGSVQSCKVTQSTGFARLDAATCKYITRRARFDPATDAIGKRLPGSYAGSIRWVIPKG